MNPQQEAFGVQPMLVVPVAGQQPPAYMSDQQRYQPETAFMSDQQRHQQETKGPLTQIIAQQDSLYKYISWQDPVKTFGFYVGVMSILFGAHYLPLTRYALKTGAIGLGAVCVTEYAGRVFGPNTFLARLRPKEYKYVPESTLNATLKDVHDFVQHFAVYIQKVMWGEDLSNTFITFLALTSLYWLAKILSPFGLLILGIHALFVAPLVTSPRGREVTQDFVTAASNSVSAAADKGTALAQQGQAKAQQLSSRATEATKNAGQRGQELADSGRQTAVDLMNQAKDTTANITQRRGQTTQSEDNKGSDLADEAKQTFSNTSGSLESDNTAKPLGEVMVPSEISSGVSELSSTKPESYGNTLDNYGDNYTHTGGTSYDNVGQDNIGIMDRGPPLSREPFATPRQMAPPPVPARKPVHLTEHAEGNRGYSNTIYQ